MIILSQRNPKWSAIKLGQSPCTIGRYGCTTTAISMLSDYFGSYIPPDRLATSILKYTADGLILWQSVNNIPSMAIELLPNGKPKRLYGRNDVEIMKSLKDSKRAVILEVEGRHWITALKKSALFNDYWCADPWFGDKCYVLKRYKKITGSAHFNSKL